MDEQVGIWCGPDNPPKSRRARFAVKLNAVEPYNNVHLKISNLSRRLARDLPPLVLDLLEIASYVYVGDQCVTRGGITLPRDGADWRRDFCYEIPVRNPGLWNHAEIKRSLIDLMQFLSDDYYDFTFRPLTQEVPSTGYFDFDEGEPWFDADEVMLFSGGLDSFAGLCQSALVSKRKVVLVSHRSAPQTDAVQRNLLQDFRSLTGSKERLLHVPVWVNKSEQLTKDTHQRTRSFLFASLAMAVAHMHKINRILFYENGITSSNLIGSESAKGTRASRTTHPQALARMARLFSALLGQEFKVENPFFWRTKADVVRVIKDSGMQGLLRYTTSCSHVRSGDPITTHCGVCSQCIGRRFAMVYNDLGGDDPEEIYKIKLPLDPIPKDMDRVMVEVLVKTARDFEKIGPVDFFQIYGSATSVVTSLPGKAMDSASRLYELHQKHGRQVCEVLERFVGANKGLVARGSLPKDSLLSMVVGTPSLLPDRKAINRFWSLPEGTRWEDIAIEIVGLDAAKIRLNGQTHATSAADMGFEDRKKKSPNKIWHLLVEFAESKGTLAWDSRDRSRDWGQKDFQRLRNSLKAFFGINDDPLMPYDKKTGYVTRFRIFYDRTVKD